MLTYSLDKKGSKPIYEFLYECIKNDILCGNLTAGEKLPSKRSFADNLGISVITVENTYSQLVAEGWQIVSVSELFKAKGMELKDGQVYNNAK